MKKFIEAFLKTNKKTPVSRSEVERIKFSESMRNQFVELKQKGLSIPVFTL